MAILKLVRPPQDAGNNNVEKLKRTV
jgi:hypothetical protein